MDNLSLFGSSPATVTATTLLQYKEKDKDRSQNRLGLNDFIREIPKTLSLQKGSSIAAGSKKDPIMELFEYVIALDRALLLFRDIPVSLQHVEFVECIPERSWRCAHRILWKIGVMDTKLTLVSVLLVL